MTTTTVHRSTFASAPHSLQPFRRHPEAGPPGGRGTDRGQDARGGLIETGVTLAGTKVLVRVPNHRITGVWLEPPAAPARTLVPVRREPRSSRRRGGLLSRIFRDTRAPLVPVAGAYSLDDDRTPWAS